MILGTRLVKVLSEEALGPL